MLKHNLFVSICFYLSPKSFAVFQIKYLVTAASQCNTPHGVLIGCVVTTQCNPESVHFQTPCKWVRELEGNSKQMSGLCYRPEIEFLLTFTCRCKWAPPWWRLIISELKHAILDDTQIGGFVFHGMVGTVIPWRFLTETKATLFDKRGLTASLGLVWDRKDRWESSEVSQSGCVPAPDHDQEAHPLASWNPAAPTMFRRDCFWQCQEGKIIAPDFFSRKLKQKILWLSLHRSTFSSLVLSWRHWPKSSGLSEGQVIGSHILLEKAGIYNQPAG